MKHVLVVIDNIVQYEKIKNIFEGCNEDDLDVDFCHSPIKSHIWEHPDFRCGNFIIDVKKDLKSIIDKYDLVISVHCYQFFPKELVKNIRCINIHPGYNPINRGWYPQVFSIIHNLPIGATIHEMDEKLDNGPIIARKFVEKYVWDTSFTLYNRVLDAEIELLLSNFADIINGDYKKIVPEGDGNMFGKADFYHLCELDMNKNGSFMEFYDLLRALSHGDYKNAFFVDEKGEKIFLNLSIEKSGDFLSIDKV